MISKDSRRTASDSIAIAKAVLDQWREMGRPVVGAFIQGSAARNGYIARGSDLDLRIVTPGEPEAEWFEERSYGPFVVEVFPLALAALRDDDSVLAHPSLPLALREAVILEDSDGIIRALRDRIVPQLCTWVYVRRRVEECFGGAQAAFKQVDDALARGDLNEARQAFSSGIWYATGIVGAIECRSPTSRRAFVVLREAAARWNRPDLREMSLEILGSERLTPMEARRLALICGEIGPRYRDGVLAMIESGEVVESAWPLFFGVLWGKCEGQRLAPNRQEEIFTALGFDTVRALRRRLIVGKTLAMALSAIAER